MKSKLPYYYLLLAIAAPLAVIFATRHCCKNCAAPHSQTAAAATTHAATAAASKPAKSGATEELAAVEIRIREKLEPVDEATEDLLKDEIAALDGIVAKYKAEQSDDVAQVLVIKASVYQRFLDDPDKAIEIFRQLKIDFPTTTQAAKADDYIAKAEARKARMAIRDSLKPGVEFPPFSVSDIDGKPIELAQYRGKVVLIDFWATWCPPCREEMPNVIAAYKKYHDKGFEIIGISLDKSKTPLREYIKKNDMTWQQVCDEKYWDADLVAKYGILGIPSTFLLDQQGRIAAKNLRGDDLDHQVEKLLAE